MAQYNSGLSDPCGTADAIVLPYKTSDLACSLRQAVWGDNLSPKPVLTDVLVSLRRGTNLITPGSHSPSYW